VARYDPTILQAFADDLYATASAVILRSTITGTLIGFAAGVAGTWAFAHGSGDVGSSVVFPALVFGIIGMVAGRLVGVGRAFKYRLEAQRTLLQMQIEANTRKPS
jgi:uncharacterized integral membrane protein